MKISGKKRSRPFRNHDLCQEVAKLMNEYAATFGTSKDASAMSRAILPKLTAKWETISNMGPLNKGVSEQIRQTVWINKQQNPDLEITAEMLTRPVTDAAAAPGGARRRRRTADATADGGGGLPAEDSIAAGNVGSPLPLPAAAAAGSCGLAAAESAAAGSAAAAEAGSLSPAIATAAVAGSPAR